MTVCNKSHIHTYVRMYSYACTYECPLKAYSRRMQIFTQIVFFICTQTTQNKHLMVDTKKKTKKKISTLQRNIKLVRNVSTLTGILLVRKIPREDNSINQIIPVKSCDLEKNEIRENCIM